jgi:hypothetical protein
MFIVEEPIFEISKSPENGSNQASKRTHILEKYAPFPPKQP